MTSGKAPQPPASPALPRLVVIVRGLDTSELIGAVDLLVNAGVHAVEVTLDSPDAFTSITTLATRFPATRIGAGTVRTVDAVAQAADAGAQFLLSPHVNTEIIRATKRRGLISVPGGFTPTEIESAWQAGADVVKVFPLHIGGAMHIRAVREPLGDIPLLACGGITAEAGRDCLEAGCVSVGVGLGLIDADALRTRDWHTLARATRRFLTTLEGRCPEL